MKVSHVLFYMLASFTLGASLILLLAARTQPREVFCDHPEWKTSGYAMVSASCDGGVTVTIVD